MENLKVPTHLAVILDGNRRWAKEKGLPVSMGHREGAKRVVELVNNCNKYNIKYLTVYAFSTENFKRSEEELGALFNIFERMIKNYTKTCIKNNVKVSIFGDYTKFNNSLRKACEDIVNKTKDFNEHYFNICLNYGGRDEIVRATKNIICDIKDNKLDIDSIDEKLFSNYLYSKDMPDVDLLIRTSGEQRLSNFLPWQTTYAEFYFPKVYFPDFKEEEFKEAILEYNNRHRRFGGN